MRLIVFIDKVIMAKVWLEYMSRDVSKLLMIYMEYGFALLAPTGL